MPDIRETGPVGLRGLKGLNTGKDVSQMSLEEQWKSIRSIPRTEYSSAPEENVGLAAMNAGYGNSQYDKGITSASQFEDIGDIRYANQPWYDTLANGIGKMLGTAGTTFVSSLVGLPYGAFEAVNQGRWSALWDNDVTQALAGVDDWLENNMTNYKSTAQQNAPWYSPENLLSMNFIADDVIKNVGFTLGAAASMATGAGAAGLVSKSLGLVNNIGKTTKGAVNLLSSLFAATGEGMIEARQGVEERNKLEMQRLDDALAPEYAALDMAKQEIDQRYSLTGDYNTYKQEMQDYLDQKSLLDQRKAAGYQEIEDSGKLMGNKILLANQGLLTLGNLIQFSKGMTRGFDAARHAAETSSKAAKPFLATAERVGNDIRQGYKVTGKGLGRTVAATKGILTEGSEEMNQQWIQNTAGYSSNRKDANDYWKARLDPEAFKDTAEGLYTFGESLDRGFKESWGDVNQWEQFLIGGLTGMAGVYMPNKVFNQDKTKSRWNPARYGEWSGGAYNELKDFNNKYRQYEENIDDVNKVLAQDDFPSRIRAMVGHTYTESEKAAALDANDKKAWKDADDKQTVHDIQAFLRAGRLDDLRAIYEDIGKQLDDEDVENIYKSTTKYISAEEDKQNFDRRTDEQIAAKQREIDSVYDEIEGLRAGLLGSVDDAYDRNRDFVNRRSKELFAGIDAKQQEIDAFNTEKEAYQGKGYYTGPYVDSENNHIVSEDEIRKTLKSNSDELNRKLDSYLESIAAVNEATGGRLTKDQEDNLAYLHNLGKESIERSNKILSNVRKQLPSKFLLKTQKSPEQLSAEYSSSDLVFSKDENTKEGYVEVDTSMMTDTAFANFFVRDILWGGNIRNEFGETADERAAREEEEKNLSTQERRKRRGEKWKKALEDSRNDAREQNMTNTALMIDGFLTNYRKNNTSTMEEAYGALENMLTDVADASRLVMQAGEYYKTLSEYMANPGKVDEARNAAEQEATKAENTKEANDKFQGKSAKEIKGDLSDGTLSMDDINSFMQGVENGSITPDDETTDAVQEAKKIADKQNSIEGYLGNVANPTVADDAAAITQWAGDAVSNADELNYEALDSFDAAQLLSDSEVAYMHSQGYTDLQILEQAEKRKENAMTALAGALEALQKDEESSNLPQPSAEDDAASFDFGDTGQDSTTKSPSNLGNESAPPKPETRNAEPQTVPTGTAEAAITEAARQEETKGTDNGGTWRSTTRRYGRRKVGGTWTYQKVPYHEIVADKDSYLYKRSKAIYEYLQSVNAFENAENASGDRIKPRDAVRFRIKSLSQEIFGKDLSDLSEEDKNRSMVILMEDAKGNIIGDLPYPELEPNPDKEEVKMLKGLYDKATEKLLTKNAKDGTTEARLDGEGGLNMKFKNNTPLVGEVFEVFHGIAPYTSERRTLNDIAGKDTAGNTAPFGLAIKVIDGQINSSPKKSVDTIGVGKVGQPYLLLPDASGKPVAVPFSTPEFNADNMGDTTLYKLLDEALTQLERYSDPSSHKDERNKAISTLCSLLQIEKPFLNTDSNDRIILNYNNLGSQDRRQAVVPKGDDWKHSLLKLLNGTPIQVSLSRINGNISLGGITANYNEVIGEVATTNLPENTRHTVASWFTIKNFSDKKERTKRVTYPEGTTNNYTISDGRVVTITTGNVWSAADPKTGEPIIGDQVVDLTLAQMQAINRGVTEGNIKVDINGKTRTYDVKNNVLKPDTTPRISQPSPADDFGSEMFGAFNNWNPGTEEEAKASETKQATAREESVKKESSRKYNTIEEAEKAAKALKILDDRKTRYAWNAISESDRIALMNGSDVTLTMNGQTKTLSVNSAVETAKILQEWNKAAKDNPDNISSNALPRKAEGGNRQADINKERRWLQKNLPMFNTEERLTLVNNLIRLPHSEEEAWGMYKEGVITLSGAAARGTLYHEAFHAVTQTLLSNEQLDNLYENASRHYKESAPALVEEMLAEDFRKYVQRGETPIIGPILKVFRRILNAIRNIAGYEAPIHQLFYKINNGEFASATPNALTSGNAFYRTIVDRVEINLQRSNNPAVKAIVADFKGRNKLIGSPEATGHAWSAFKNYWEGRGYYPKGSWSKRLVDRPGYVLNDILVKEGDRMVSIVDSEKLEREMLEEARIFAAMQARKGRMELLQWDRLSPEQQSNLQDSGFSRKTYTNMSLEEKEQVLYCNG